MKRWNIFSFTTVLFTVLFFLMTVNIFAIFSEEKSFVQFVNALTIPVFVVFTLLKYKPNNISFFFFCLFIFLSDSASLFLQDINVLYASNVFYVAASIHLLILVLPKLDLIHADKSIKAYLLLMFLISAVFLSLVYNAIESVFVDRVEAMLFVVKCLVFIILGLASFGVYLKSENKKSIFFLTAVICFGFSVICSNLNIYFLSEWRFEMLNRLLHLIGLYFIFKYIIEESYNETIYTNYSENLRVSNKTFA